MSEDIENLPKTDDQSRPEDGSPEEDEYLYSGSGETVAARGPYVAVLITRRSDSRHRMLSRMIVGWALVIKDLQQPDGDLYTVPYPWDRETDMSNAELNAALMQWARKEGRQQVNKCYRLSFTPVVGTAVGAAAGGAGGTAAVLLAERVFNILS